MELDPQFIALVSVIGGAGAAWGVSKATQKSTRDWLESVDKKLDKHIEDDRIVQLEVVDRLARIETKIDRLQLVDNRKEEG